MLKYIFDSTSFKKEKKSCKNSYGNTNHISTLISWCERNYSVSYEELISSRHGSSQLQQAK